MDEYLLNTFLQQLFSFLTETEANERDLNIFRKHNTKLDKNADISFSLNSNAWKHVNESNDKAAILNYIQNSSDFDDLLKSSQNWIVPISKYSISNSKLFISLNRLQTFRIAIRSVLNQSSTYGHFPKNPELKTQIIVDTNNANDLSQLRLNLLRDVTTNILEANGYCTNYEDESDLFCLTNKSVNKFDCKSILCGVVLGEKFGKKCTEISAEEFYKKRTIDMQLMAQHKYGVRVNSESGWKDFFRKLGNAAVTIDLLSVSPSHTLVININNPLSPHSKGASFVLYNCARLSSIFKRFDQKVEDNLYQPLPDLSAIDFSLLNQPEEWELLFVYIIQFPQLVKSCINEIKNCKLRVHNLCTFLDSFCLIFSLYYRRIRILTVRRI